MQMISLNFTRWTLGHYPLRLLWEKWESGRGGKVGRECKAAAFGGLGITQT